MFHLKMTVFWDTSDGTVAWNVTVCFSILSLLLMKWNGKLRHLYFMSQSECCFQMLGKVSDFTHCYWTLRVWIHSCFLMENKGCFNRFQLEAQGLTNICLVQSINDTLPFWKHLSSSLNQPFTEWFNQLCCLWNPTGQQQGQEGVKVQSAPVTVTVGNISSTSPEQMGQVQSPSETEGQPGKRLRRVACSCPNCRDGEGRYVPQH